MISRIISSASVALLALIVCVLVGCTGRGVTLASNQVTLKVWVGLGGLSETIGSPTNDGCRLTQAEITAIVNDLQANASMFGPNVQFVWDGTVEIVRDSQLNSRAVQSPISSLLLAVQTGVLNPRLPMWEAGAVNIYFTGDYRTSSGGGVWGAAADPRDFALPFVMINDGGFDFQLKDPTALTVRLTPEHEVAHYLARFTTSSGSGRAFGLGAFERIYEGEHVNTRITHPGIPGIVGPDAHALQNILLDGIDVPASGIRYANMPGLAPVQSQASGRDELGEVALRIQQGNWNNP